MRGRWKRRANCRPIASSSISKTRWRRKPRPQAREAIVKALETGFGDREVMVRINGLDTRWWVEDLNTVLGGQRKPDAILVPKISDPSQLEDLAARFVDLHTDPHVRVWAMMETPLAMLNAQQIAGCGARYRDAPRRLRHGHQRSRQGYARPARARPRADAALADDLRRRRARLRPRAFSTASITISAMPRASSRSASRRAISASTARRSSTRARSSRATRYSRRAPTKSRWRAR